MNAPKNNEVLLGMSGGTDSSVAAMLLQDAGYKVTGVTFRFYDTDDSSTHLDDARALAERLHIPHLVYDARTIFKSNVVDYFIDEYMSGRTPVPCVRCNNLLKWPLLAKIADEQGITYIATGHYVRKAMKNGLYFIRQAVDADKDQSFFLWGLSQDILQRMLLPMGELTKVEARAFAARRGFHRVSSKKDSIGVCFCPFDYHTFLKKHVPDEAIQRGRFVDENGHFIAWHAGYPFYTVGQRRGLGIHLNKAVYVKEIFPETNEVVLASISALERMEMELKDWCVVDKASVFGVDDLIVKIRYRKQANTCMVTQLPNGNLQVALHEPLTAIASGQAAAFYKDGLVLGGGIIV